MRRRGFLEQLGVLLGAAMLSLALGCGAEPTFEGRAVSDWIDDLNTSIPAEQDRPLAALVAMGQSALPALERALEDKDRHIRLGAGAALIRLGERGRESVLEACQSEYLGIRVTAATAMIRENWRPDQAVIVLGGVMTDDRVTDEETWVCRLAAIKAFGELGPTCGAAAPGLARLLENPSEEVRSRAAFALARIGPPAAEAVEALTKALGDKSPQVREGAAYALGAMGEAARGAEAALRVAQQSDANAKVRHRAGQALGRL